MKVLIVIDMQNDFTTGVLGNPETASVVKNVTEYIRKFRETEPDGKIIATLDTHNENYMNTQEGKYLPVPHCIRGTDGWNIVPEVEIVLGDCIRLEKITFGAIDLPFAVGRDENIEEIFIEDDGAIVEHYKSNGWQRRFTRNVFHRKKESNTVMQFVDVEDTLETLISELINGSTDDVDIAKVDECIEMLQKLKNNKENK